MTMEVSAEVHFAQTLASNDKKFRDRALKRLKKYISVRSCNGAGLSHEDFLKLWKGLHYCMWMQDKPLIQEELSQKIVSLLHAFSKLQDVLRFVHVFFITEAREWTGIDRLRLDKFMLLIREMLHETFELLGREGWPVSECQIFSQNLTSVIMNEDSVKIPYGIKMHLTDIFLFELQKVSFKGMNAKKFTILMFPFIYFLLQTKRRDLAQTVYEKTLKVALQEFGNWSWEDNQKDAAGSNLKSKMVENDADVDASSEDEEEEEDTSSDEDEEAEMEEENEGESGMEVDEEEVTAKKVKFDLSNLLRLMHILAQDPKVEIRNRRYVYGIVNNYVSKDPTILQSPQNDCKDSCNLDITRVYQLTGEPMKEDCDNKKRRRRNRKRRQEEERGEVVVESQDSVRDNITAVTKEVGKGEGVLTTASQLKKLPVQGLDKKKKNKKGAVQTQSQEVLNNHVSSPLNQITENKKKEKGVKEPEKEHPLKDVASKNAGKKRKRMSSDGEEMSSNDIPVKKLKSSVGSIKSKNMKSSSDNIGSNVGEDIDDYQSPAGGKLKPKGSPISTTPKSTNKQKNKMALFSSEDSDANTNARSPPRTPGDKGKNKFSTFISPVECVVYKQKSPSSKPSAINKLVTLSATTKFSVSETSPSRSKRNIDPNALVASAAVPPPTTSAVSADSGDEAHVTVPDRVAAKASGSKIGARSPVGAAGRKSSPVAKQSSPNSPSAKKKAKKSEVAEVEESSVMSSLYNMISTPCSMIKKAVGGMVAPATDPGVSREKTVTLPEQLTPGTQKKVVFDLRRNKANKFQDYLKTLASDQSSPAFEPSKSPSHGILKSASSDSFVSSADSTPTTTKKRKGKASTPKRKSQSPLLRGSY